MSGFIGTLIAGFAVAIEDIKRNNITQNNKQIANKNSESIYRDGNNQFRSTKTNELIYKVFKENSVQYTGVKTGNIYKDTIDDNNRYLSTKGKKYIYKNISYGKYGGTKQWKFDIEKQKPFKVTHNYANLCNGFKGSINIIYYNDVEKDGIGIADWSISKTIMEDDKEYFAYI